MNLTNIRHNAKLTQQALAKKINRSRTLVSAYENNKTTPPIETMQKLAKALDVDLQTIVNCFVKNKKDQQE